MRRERHRGRREKMQDCHAVLTSWGRFPTGEKAGGTHVEWRNPGFPERLALARLRRGGGQAEERGVNEGCQRLGSHRLQTGTVCYSRTRKQHPLRAGCWLAAPVRARLGQRGSAQPGERPRWAPPAFGWDTERPVPKSKGHTAAGIYSGKVPYKIVGLYSSKTYVKKEERWETMPYLKKAKETWLYVQGVIVD